MKNKKTLAVAMLMLTAIIWGMAFVFQRVGMDKIEPITFNAARMASAAIFVSLVSWIADKRKSSSESHSGEDRARQIKSTVIGGVCCGIFLTLASNIQQMGIVHTSAGKAGFITAMYMLFVPILNFLIFKKKTGAKIWIAVGLGLLGMYMLCVKEEFTVTKGDALVLLCALMFSGHILCCDHFAPRCDPIKLSAVQFITAAILSTALAFIAESPSIEKIVSAAVPILYCGILSGGVGYTLQIIGQKHTDPTTASLIMSLESVFAVIAGVVVLNEKMALAELFGCIIMFAAIILVQLPSHPKKND